MNHLCQSFLDLINFSEFYIKNYNANFFLNIRFECTVWHFTALIQSDRNSNAWQTGSRFSSLFAWFYFISGKISSSKDSGSSRKQCENQNSQQYANNSYFEFSMSEVTSIFFPYKITYQIKEKSICNSKIQKILKAHKDKISSVT